MTGYRVRYGQLRHTGIGVSCHARNCIVEQDGNTFTATWDEPDGEHSRTITPDDGLYYDRMVQLYEKAARDALPRLRLREVGPRPYVHKM